MSISKADTIAAGAGADFVAGAVADSVAGAVADTDRRARVLESALTTFARYGYRKTSMDHVATMAHISRPGLYFLFTSKESLFRAAVTQRLESDLMSAERVLSSNSPLRDRLLAAFDYWAGSYVGPLARDITGVIDDNPALLGDIVTTAPQRFEELIIRALAAEGVPERAPDSAPDRASDQASEQAPHRASDRASEQAPDRASERASAIARTLISTSIGIKHQVDSRADYRDRLSVALELLVG